MNCLGLAFMGTITEKEIEDLTRELVKAIRMNEGPGSATFRYPNEDIGEIHVRCIRESFLAVDNWNPFIAGGYIFINSCGDFDPQVAIAVIEAMELTVVSSFDAELHLPTGGTA